MINTCLLEILTQRSQNRVFRNFFFEMNAKNIVKEPTCFESLSNPSCIDLVITNSYSNFQNTKAISTGLSYFHKMVVIVLKHTFHRSVPKELVLEDKLNQQINEYKHFEKMFLEILNIQAPIKKKLMRANHVPYMTKALRRAIMKRSEL